MAAFTFHSATNEALVAEIARTIVNVQSGLATPLADVTITVGNANMTINAALPFNISSVAADGSTKVVYTDRSAGDTGVYTGTPLAAVTPGSLSDALAIAMLQLDAAEAAKIAANVALPAGAGVTYSLANGVGSFTAVLPITISLDTTGNQVITVTPYSA